jgi:hypothetical protein
LTWWWTVVEECGDDGGGREVKNSLIQTIVIGAADPKNRGVRKCSALAKSFAVSNPSKISGKGLSAR